MSEAMIAYYAAVLDGLRRYVCDAHPLSFVTDAADGRTTVSLVLDTAALSPYMARLDGAVAGPSEGDLSSETTPDRVSPAL